MSSEGKTVVYARQSLDRHGDSLAVDRQIKLCQQLADERGWTVVEEYVDNDRSATSGRERPSFDALLHSEPARIIVWHVDRLVRLTRDLERVIELGINVHAVQAGHLDLSNPAGRAVARTITAWSTYETEQKAIRQRAANDQRAAAGLPYGTARPFGFEPGGMEIRESEAAELRAAGDKVLHGQSLSAICRDLNERNVLTAIGNTWKPMTLRTALLSPRNAGLRRHRGEVIGTAAWPAILDDGTVTALQALFNDPARRRTGPTRRYLLSGVMLCEVCREPVTGAYIKDAGKGATYRCLGHVQRKTAYVDAAITAVMAARLSMPDALEVLTNAAESEDRVQELRTERADLRVRLDGLAEAYAATQIDAQQLSAGTARLRERVATVENELAAAMTSPALSELATSDDIAEAFQAMPMESQRTVIDEFAEITLLRVGTGRRFDPADSLRVKWRT